MSEVRELGSPLTIRLLLLNINDILYTSYAKSAILFDSETWAVNDDGVKKLECAENSMAR